MFLMLQLRTVTLNGLWAVRSPVPVTPFSPPDPGLVEIENLPQNSAADHHNRERLSATSELSQHGRKQ